MPNPLGNPTTKAVDLNTGTSTGVFLGTRHKINNAGMLTPHQLVVHISEDKLPEEDTGTSWGGFRQGQQGDALHWLVGQTNPKIKESHIFIPEQDVFWNRAGSVEDFVGAVLGNATDPSHFEEYEPSYFRYIDAEQAPGYGEIEFLLASAPVTPSLITLYSDSDQIERLLGSAGSSVLDKIVQLIKREAFSRLWPLDKIEVSYGADLEVQDWKYVVIILTFSCSFEKAYAYLQELYVTVDLLADGLSDEDRAILERLIYFDIESKSGISSI